MKKTTNSQLELLPDFFTPKEAALCGLTPYQLSKLLLEGLLEKAGRGLYRKVAVVDLGEWTSFVAASKQIHHRNALCLLSALVYHKLAEVIPTTVWLLVDFQIRTTKEGITLFRKRDPQWNIGIIKDDSIFVTDLERTLVECLVFKNKVGYNEAFFALKKALNKKHPMTTVAHILDRAQELEVEHLIQKTMEPFIYE